MSQQENKYFEGRTSSRVLKGHKKSATTTAWNSNGKLASGSADHTCRIWDVQVSESREFAGHSHSVVQLCFDPQNPEVFASASQDKTVRLWDIRSRKQIAKIDTTGENINISWRPDGSHIVVGNKDDEITIIDAKKRKKLKAQKFEYEINEVKWNDKGNILMMTTGGGAIEVFRYDTENLYEDMARSIQSNASSLYCIEFSHNGKYFGVGSADSTVSIYSLPEMICVHNISRMDYPVRTLSFSYDTALIAHASEGGIIDISTVDTAKQVHEIKTSAAVNSVSWHPKEYLLAHASDNGEINVFGFPNS